MLCIFLLEEQIHLPWQSQKISEFSAGVTFRVPCLQPPLWEQAESRWVDVMCSSA